jgi:hypothetical protein
MEEAMRHVYTNHEVPHLWAHQSQREARNSNGTLYFIGDTIYSYGSHFAIAKHVSNDRGQRAVLFTTARYSVTTAGHCSAVARAIPPTVPVFHVPEVTAGLSSHDVNVQSYIHRITGVLTKEKRARVNRYWHQQQALTLREELNSYLAFFDLSTTIALPESVELSELQVWTTTQEEQERARRIEVARLAEETLRRDRAEQILRFRSGDPNVNYISGVPPLLRVVKDEVHTSLGARFPVWQARRALSFVIKVRESASEYIRNENAVALGHYVIDRIEADGTVHSGCHVVRWDEIERISSQLQRSENPAE